MRKVLIILLLLPVVSFAQEQTERNPFLPLEFLIGSWEGDNSGKAGVGHGYRSYEKILNGLFIRGATTMTFEPQENKLEGEVHKDLSIFSFDKSRQKIVIREFYTEGYVNTFVLDSLSSDGRTIRFLTEESENAPPGLKARLLFQIKDNDHFKEQFELGFPGRDFSCFMTIEWKRIAD